MDAAIHADVSQSLTCQQDEDGQRVVAVPFHVFGLAINCSIVERVVYCCYSLLLLSLWRRKKTSSCGRLALALLPRVVNVQTA